MSRVAIICPYPIGVAPSQRLKYEQYIHHWEKNGFKVDVLPFQSNAMWNIVYQEGKWGQKIFWTFIGYFHRLIILFQIYHYDIVYIHLWVTPFGFPIFERLYRLCSKKIIYDIDDLIFMGHSSKANRWITRLKGTQKPIYLIQYADYVITTTPYLVNFCQKMNSNIIGIPPTIPLNTIRPTEVQNKSKIVIGWSGSSSTAKYLDIVKKAILNLSKKYAIELLLFGIEDYSIEGIKTRCIAWSEDREQSIFYEMDIAIYPLENEEWSEGKFGGKLIQYFAAGLPIVASKANKIISEIIINHQNGICIENSISNWEEAISYLIDNIEIRKKLSIHARKTFELQFSCEQNEEIYLQILNSVIKN